MNSQFNEIGKIKLLKLEEIKASMCFSSLFLQIAQRKQRTRGQVININFLFQFLFINCLGREL